jgi:hypothetical protein
LSAKRQVTGPAIVVITRRIDQYNKFHLYISHLAFPRGSRFLLTLKSFPASINFDQRRFMLRCIFGKLAMRNLLQLEIATSAGLWRVEAFDLSDGA